METAKSYIHLLTHLKTRFSGSQKHKVRLLGLVFCSPNTKLAREEILPALRDYDFRSGENIDFYFAGFDKKPAYESSDIVIPVGIPSKPVWYFNFESFHALRLEIQGRTNWEYSGGSDFMLVNCCYDDKGEPHLDFKGAIILTLEELRQQGKLPYVGMFFEEIFRHCEAVKESDEAWGCGLDAEPGSALMELCKSYLKDNGKNAKESATPMPNMIKGLFRYDMATRALIIMPSGQKHIVDHRYAEVLRRIFKREAGLYAIRVSQLDSLQIASFFEMGKWKEGKTEMDDSDLQKKLEQEILRIEYEKTRLAQEFYRQFARWLRDRRIDPHSVIISDRKNSGYKLGSGWHSKRMVIGDSEPGLNYASHYVEKIGPDGNSGKTPSHMGMGDGKDEFDD